MAVATAVREQVAEVWLDQRCNWAADTLVAGNTWAAAEHHWTLIAERGVLRAAQT